MKNMIYDTLKTEYFDDALVGIPFDFYPRPSLRRESFLNLNGYWDYAETDGEIPEQFGEKILVPYPPESALSGIERQTGENKFSVYRRYFDLPSGFLKDRFILHFGAVDTVCSVYLNGTPLGEHEGGYLPFSFDCTEHIKPSGNELCVVCKGDLTRTYPYGKKKKNRGGMWYTPTSGIWQTVWAESVPLEYITGIQIRTDMNAAYIKVLGAVDGACLKLCESGEVFEIKDGRVNVCPKEKRLWSPESPELYYFEIYSGNDSVGGYFGLREIGIKSCDGIPRLTLNGRPYLFNGLLDQGYFPDGILTPATVEGFKNDILKTKSLGFNTLRKHIKIEPEIFYYLCDTLGMVVFQDMVNNSGYSFILDTALPTIGLRRLPDCFRHRNRRTRDIFKAHMKATLEHLYNFPSILYYTIFNEGWGQFSSDEMYRLAKSIDDSRVIDSTSGWFVRKESDVDSRHVYFKPVKIGKIGERPVVISEFGGYSHRVSGHLFGEENYGYKMFESREDFEAEFDRLYLEEILPGIKKGICALIYTQVSDVEDETNGVMTYDRRVLKLDAKKTSDIMNRLTEEMKRSI